jgi:hypothetical protein
LLYLDAVRNLLASLGIAVTIEDCRTTGAPIPFAFTGALRLSQEPAIAALLPHDTGVLAATTAFGKTVLAIRMMAERGLNTLILVHRRQLMDQWIERLTAFSSLPRDAIGMTLRPGSPMYSLASPPTPPKGSMSCCPGTGRLRNSKALRRRRLDGAGQQSQPRVHSQPCR